MKKKSKSNILLYVLLAVLIAGIGFSGWKLYGILRGYYEASSEFHSLSDTYKVTSDAAETEPDPPADTSSPYADETGRGEPLEEPAEEPKIIFQSVGLECPFSVLFEKMWETSRDVAAWISSPGTAIDYPVMHGATNETYLHANWKGSYSSAGSIFTSYRCSGMLDDLSTIIYGHNMKDGSMFHSIKSYSSQTYYEDHPYLWYVTPEADYILYLVAGLVVSTSDELYSIPSSEEEVQEFITEAMERSDFTADYVVSGLDADAIAGSAKRMVVLSTCSYEFNNARYVLVAVPLLAESDPVQDMSVQN